MTRPSAREWLDSAKYPNHEVAEMTNQVAREIVDGFYERGAGKVYVISPFTLRDKVLTPGFAVQLPADPSRRKQCFDWKAKFPIEDRFETTVRSTCCSAMTEFQIRADPQDSHVFASRR